MRNGRAASWIGQARQHMPILLLLTLGLFLGLILGNDYGMTFDEHRNAIVGETALDVYFGGDEYFTRPALDEHGPAYFMMFTMTAKTADAILPNYTEADGRHLTHYLTFLATLGCLYLLALRFTTRNQALMAVLFIFLQPMIFGRAFINQKDTPFMAFFTASFVIGLIAADRWLRAEVNRPREPLAIRQRLNSWWNAIKGDYQALQTWKKGLLLSLLTIAALMIIDLLFLQVSSSIGKATIRAAYDGNATWPIQALYERLATDAYKTPVSLYIEKFQAAYQYGRFAGAMLIGLSGLMLSSFFLPSLAASWGFSWRALRQPWLYGAGALLGITICIRQLGIFVGGLVSLYMLYRHQARSIFPLLLYWLTAAVVTVATWPYLWEDPIRKFVDSMLLASSFPAHRQFFQGQSLSSANLPWHFFPTLAGIEHTEPAAILFLLGIILAAWRMVKGGRGWFELALIGLWFGVPLVGLIGFGMTVYGNLRHLLFILAPMLLLAGWAMAEISSRIRPTWLGYGFVGLILLPGILGIIRLHPYEYVYKNSYTGGLSGAFQYYELDRECISLREGMEFVNEVAEPRDRVMILRQISQVVPYAREDLILIDDNLSYDLADYILACYFPRQWDFSDQGFERVYQVRAGSAVLTDVWKQKQSE